jgi:hypothetical protein
VTEETDEQKNKRDEAAIVDRLYEDDVKRLVELSVVRDLDWFATLRDWFYEFDNGAFTVDQHGASIEFERIIVALYESGILDKHAEGEISKAMIDMLVVFQRWGVQTASSVYCEMHPDAYTFGRYRFLEAAILLLMRRGLIELALPPNDKRTTTDSHQALVYHGRCKARLPSINDDVTVDFYVRR